MQITNIAGYQFVPLDELTELRSTWMAKCESLGLKGTILLSKEGINVSLAGEASGVEAFKRYMKEDSRFAQMTYRESLSQQVPFRRLKIKLRKEIITMRRPEIQAELERAPSISPKQLKQWLDEQRDFTLLDTRNDYEVEFGTFKTATHLNIKDFSHFPEASVALTPEKPIVMFCTGGVRCEKAAIHLKNQGFSEVYQLDGGILNYFTEVGGEHYQGECFVFDGRISVDTELQETLTRQCERCQGPQFNPDVSCPACLN